MTNKRLRESNYRIPISQITISFLFLFGFFFFFFFPSLHIFFSSIFSIDHPRIVEGWYVIFGNIFSLLIEFSGYGKFNYLLLLAVLPASCASIFSSSSTAYVLPSAECDLELTMLDKGLLNSMSFAGSTITNEHSSSFNQKNSIL